MAVMFHYFGNNSLPSDLKEEQNFNNKTKFRDWLDGSTGKGAGPWSLNNLSSL